MKDFNDLCSDSSKFEKVKEDILTMFVQQASVTGFLNPKIGGLKHARKLLNDYCAIKKLATRIPVKFGFIMADYKQESTALSEQISMFEDDFLFATSSFMGYGLYERCIINRQQLIDRLNENHNP